MNALKQWFDEVEMSVLNVHRYKGSEFVIYKGFKLSKTLDQYKLEDVRVSDFYGEVKKRDYNVLLKLGFIRGADEIVNKRNIRRVGIYTRLLEKLYADRKEYQKKLRPLKTREFYRKKIRNCQENIHKNIDLLFLYKSRIEQYNLKYKKNK
jgi:hypothetical protein